jgi:hypothetical protein
VDCNDFICFKSTFIEKTALKLPFLSLKGQLGRVFVPKTSDLIKTVQIFRDTHFQVLNIQHIVVFYLFPLGSGLNILDSWLKGNSGNMDTKSIQKQLTP